MELDSPPTPLRVLIADSSEGNTNTWSELLEEYDDFEIVGHARTAVETLSLTKKLQPELLLLDMEMLGEMFGCVVKLIKAYPKPPVLVVLIPYASAVFAERCFTLGADYTH